MEIANIINEIYNDKKFVLGKLKQTDRGVEEYVVVVESIIDVFQFSAQSFCKGCVRDNSTLCFDYDTCCNKLEELLSKSNFKTDSYYYFTSEATVFEKYDSDLAQMYFRIATVSGDVELAREILDIYQDFRNIDVFKNKNYQDHLDIWPIRMLEWNKCRRRIQELLNGADEVCIDYKKLSNPDTVKCFKNLKKVLSADGLLTDELIADILGAIGDYEKVENFCYCFKKSAEDFFISLAKQTLSVVADRAVKCADDRLHEQLIEQCNGCDEKTGCPFVNNEQRVCPYRVCL